MGLSTYAELKTSIAAYMHRSDLTSVIPDFVTLAEKRIVDDLMKSGGHSAIEDSTSLAVTSYEATMPSDMIGVRTIITGDSTRQEVPIVSFDQIRTKYQNAGSGRAAAIKGSTVVFSPDASNTSPTLHYYKSPTAMSADGDTNQLFPKLNYCYLYASLIEACLYTKKDPTGWASAYQDAINSAIKTNRFSKYGNGLAVRAA